MKISYSDIELFIIYGDGSSQDLPYTVAGFAFSISFL